MKAKQPKRAHFTHNGSAHLAQRDEGEQSTSGSPLTTRRESAAKAGAMTSAKPAAANTFVLALLSSVVIESQSTKRFTCVSIAGKCRANRYFPTTNTIMMPSARPQSTVAVYAVP